MDFNGFIALQYIVDIIVQCSIKRRFPGMDRVKCNYRGRRLGRARKEDEHAQEFRGPAAGR